MLYTSLNPLNRVNSILIQRATARVAPTVMSQSPKSGQFNSDDEQYTTFLECHGVSQSPKSGQFNSDTDFDFISHDRIGSSLNPLNRVNSILIQRATARVAPTVMSQSPKSGQFNSDEKKTFSVLQ